MGHDRCKLLLTVTFLYKLAQAVGGITHVNDIDGWFRGWMDSPGLAHEGKALLIELIYQLIPDLFV